MALDRSGQPSSPQSVNTVLSNGTLSSGPSPRVSPGELDYPDLKLSCMVFSKQQVCSMHGWHHRSFPGCTGCCTAQAAASFIFSGGNS